jgi:hypothetical protein
MKKIVLAMISVVSTSVSFAASSVADLSSGPAKKEDYQMVNVQNNIDTRRVKSDANLYYVAKDKRSDVISRNYNGCIGDECYNTARSIRADEKRTKDERKYNLNNPFYQPKQGDFASVTDLSYRDNSLEFSVLPGTGGWQNHAGKYSATSTVAAEHLSYGISDDFAVIGGLEFAKSNLDINWDTISAPFNHDKGSDSKLDMWGFGAQWRFVNNDKWIGTLMGTYEKMVDVANVFTGDVKAGYKVNNMTVYGFGRLYMLDWEGEGYGFGLTNQYDQIEYFTLEPTASSSVYYDLGMGVFTAINKDWSTDLTLGYSDAEWHTQVWGRASVSYQPWKNAAFTLYGKIALMDSADDFNESTIIFVNNDGSVSMEGVAAFDNYSDTTVGLQLTLAF